MAESIIQRPFKSYIVVATSSASSDSYKNKLQGLKSHFDNLSASQKCKSFLLFGTYTLYSIQHTLDGRYALIQWSNTQHTYLGFTIADLSTGERKTAAIKSDGSTEISDTSNEVTTTNIKLCYSL